METTFDTAIDSMMGMTIEQLEDRARYWTRIQLAEAKLEEQHKREDELLQQGQVFEALALKLPESLRPLLAFQGFWSRTSSFQHFASFKIVHPRWCIYVTLEKLGAEWILRRSYHQDPFTPLRPELIWNEDDKQWHINWLKSPAGDTDTLLDAIAGAMALAADLDQLQDEMNRRNADPAAAPIQDLAYERVDGDQVKPSFGVEIESLLRKAVREEIKAQSI